MRQTFTVIIQSNSFGGKKFSYSISRQKAEKLCRLLEPEEKKRRAREDCSSIKLDKFFKETN
tara:strand:- start:55 stop:240 length:186 start_codon:yes stop_codon:yes gene_type:complete